MNKRSEIASIQCVAGRDRIDCLDIVEWRGADFMAVDPEDLYLAFKKKNEDFAVLSDIRINEKNSRGIPLWRNNFNQKEFWH